MVNLGNLHEKCKKLDKLNKKFILYTWLSYTVVFISLILLIIAFFYATFPFKTLKINRMEILNKDKKVCAGDYLEVLIDYEKYTNKPALVTKQLINSYVMTFDSQPSNMPFGKGIIIDSTGTKIPENAPSGRYKLRMTIIYDLNILNRRILVYESDYFEVRSILLNKNEKKQFRLLVDKIDSMSKEIKILKTRQDERIAREKNKIIIIR